MELQTKPEDAGFGPEGSPSFFEQDSNTHTVIDPASVTDPPLLISSGYPSCLHLPSLLVNLGYVSD